MVETVWYGPQNINLKAAYLYYPNQSARFSAVIDDYGHKPTVSFVRNNGGGYLQFDSKASLQILEPYNHGRKRLEIFMDPASALDLAHLIKAQFSSDADNEPKCNSKTMFSININIDTNRVHLDDNPSFSDDLKVLAIADAQFSSKCAYINTGNFHSLELRQQHDSIQNFQDDNPKDSLSSYVGITVPIQSRCSQMTEPEIRIKVYLGDLESSMDERGVLDPDSEANLNTTIAINLSRGNALRLQYALQLFAQHYDYLVANLAPEFPLPENEVFTSNVVHE